MLRGPEDCERSRSTTEMKPATAVRGDMLVMANVGAEEVAEFVVASTEPIGCAEAFETAHTSDAAFDTGSA